MSRSRASNAPLLAGSALFLGLASGMAHADALRIMPLGDSITQGTNSCSYRTPLVRSLEDSCLVRMVGSEDAPRGAGAPNCITSNVDHEGHSGWRTTTFLQSAGDGRTRLERYVDEARPDVVLLHIGSNDMNGRKNPGRYDPDSRSGSGVIGGIDTMLDQIYAEVPAASVFLANLIPWPRSASVDADIDMLRTEIESLAATRAADGERLTLVDVSTGFRTDMLQGDLVHPNARGDAHIASRWLEAMRSQGLCASGGNDGSGNDSGSGGGDDGGNDGSGDETPFSIRAEAESGNVVGGMQIGTDSGASGGLYASFPGRGSSAALQDAVEIALSVPRRGKYRIRARVFGPTSGSNSFFVKIGDSDTWLWHFNRSPAYRTRYVTSASRQVEVYLEAGTHIAHVYRREAGARLDWVELEFLGEDRSGDTDGDGASNATDAYPNDGDRGGEDHADRLRVEAEDGTLVGAMRVGGEAGASGGRYVGVPGTGSSGALRDYVALSFRTAVAGTYRLRARVHAPHNKANSFFVQIADGDTWKWHTRLTGSAYAEDYVDSEGGGQVRVRLPAGTHVAKVFRRENGTRLDWLELERVAAKSDDDIDGDGATEMADLRPDD